jgi:hypothetical protein
VNDVWERERTLNEDIRECLVFKGDEGEERESMIRLVR